MRLGGQDVHDKEIEAQHGGSRLCPDLGRVEPLQALATVEQHLQPDRSERECREAEEIKGRSLRGSLLWQRERHGKEDEPRHRQADIEQRAPAMIFTEPAADAGTAEEAEQLGYRRDQVYAGVPRGWQYIEQDCQRQRREGSPCATLDDARGDELQRSCRTRREHKAERENGDGYQIDRFPAVTVCKPARHRHGDDARRDIRREYPTDLIIGHRQRAFDIEQRRIGQRDGGRLHAGRHQRGDDDGALPVGGCVRCACGTHFAASLTGIVWSGCSKVRR